MGVDLYPHVPSRWVAWRCCPADSGPPAPPQAGCRSWPADWRPPTTWWARAQLQGTALARVTTVAASPTGRVWSFWVAHHCAAPISPPCTSHSAASPAWVSATCPPTRTRRRSSPSAPCSSVVRPATLWGRSQTSPSLPWSQGSSQRFFCFRGPRNLRPGPGGLTWLQDSTPHSSAWALP